MDKQEWNSEGLPPVGTVCEAIFNEASKTYYKTTVFGVNEHGQPIHRWEEGPGIQTGAREAMSNAKNEFLDVNTD